LSRIVAVALGWIVLATVVILAFHPDGFWFSWSLAVGFPLLVLVVIAWDEREHLGTRRVRR
jgi:hypothetical protein